MRGVARLLCAGLFATGIGGCLGSVPVTCIPDELVAPRLTCDAAVNAAMPLFGTLSGVVGLEFKHQVCRDDARCAFPDDAAGDVVAELSDGRRFAVFVSIDAGGRLVPDQLRLLTPEPQPVPADQESLP